MNDDFERDFPQPEPAPDEFNPHSPHFYQNVPGSDGSYINDAFSRGYTDEYGNQSGHFDDDPDFQGFQGYYDNSGFEGYEGYKGPDPYYRGYYGNTGYNPSQLNPNAFPPVDDPSQHYSFQPNYEQLRRNSEQFYYQGYKESEYNDVAPAKVIKKDDYDMPYYHFAAVSHLWSAAGLVLSFIGSMLSIEILKMIDPFFPAIRTGMRNAVMSDFIIDFTPLLLFFIGGALLYNPITKKGLGFASGAFVIFSACCGLCTTPAAVFFIPDNTVFLYGYLLCAAVLFITSMISLISKKALTSIPGLLCASGAGEVLFLVICYYIPVDPAIRDPIMIFAGILLIYSAFDSISVKRSYDEYIVDDNTLYKHAIVAAIGHYVTFATLIFRLFGLAVDSGLSGSSSKNRGDMDVEFAESFKFDQNEIWK